MEPIDHPDEQLQPLESKNERVDCSIDPKTLSREQLLDEQRKIEDELAEIRAVQTLERTRQSSACCGSRPKRPAHALS